MAEPIKIPEEDLNKIREIQIQFQQKLEEFGKLYLEKMGIDEAIKMVANREIQVQNEWKEIQKKESDFIEDLLKRFGEGNLDLKQGLFIPQA
jgi:hypothetical protein